MRMGLEPCMSLGLSVHLLSLLIFMYLLLFFPIVFINSKTENAYPHVYSETRQTEAGFSQYLLPGKRLQPSLGQIPSVFYSISARGLPLLQIDRGYQQDSSQQRCQEYSQIGGSYINDTDVSTLFFFFPANVRRLRKNPNIPAKHLEYTVLRDKQKMLLRKGTQGLTLWHRQLIHGVRASHQLILKICLLVHPLGYCLLQSLNPLLPQILSWPSYLMDSLFSLLPISCSAFRVWDC